MTVPKPNTVQPVYSFLLGVAALAVLALALVFGPHFIQYDTPFLSGPPTEGGKAALDDVITQARAANPQGRPTWLTGSREQGGCALPAKVLEAQDWVVLDLIEHDGEFASLYAVCTVRQVTLVRARFRWPGGDIEYTVRDLEATDGR